MTAIVGHAGVGGGRWPLDACTTMAAWQTAYGPHGTTIRSLGRASFGRNLFRLVPEDAHDRQPLTDESQGLLLVADVRLDNRADLCRSLGMDDLHNVSDADLLLAAWREWSVGAIERLRGDYAMAVWNSRTEELTLARGPLSSRPIFYHEGPGFIAFASTPVALTALPSMPRQLDFSQASAFLVRASGAPGATYFVGVKRLEQGHVARWSEGGLRLSRFWAVESRSLSYRSQDQYVEAFRELLDRAVEARLRREHGEAASQLSSGRDSSAITATAARLLESRREKLYAFTAAPRAGFNGPIPDGRLADESELAARTAQMYANVDHRVCRPEGAPFEGVELVHRLGGAPLGHLTNHPWVKQIGEQASSLGATILLTGEGGNFTISAGGRAHFPRFVRERGVVAGFKLAQRMRSAGLGSWLSLLNACLGGYLPLPVYRLVAQASGRHADFSRPLRLLRPEYRRMAQAHIEAEFWDVRPPRDYMDFRRRMLLRREVSNKWSLACWGLDWRDPTVDRDLVDFCFSLPVELLVSATAARPIFEAAMADRLPREILRSSRRGYQGADWFCSFTQAVVREEFRQSASHELVQELLDVAYVEQLIEDWPKAHWDRWPVTIFYRNHVLAAVSLANFVAVNF